MTDYKTEQEEFWAGNFGTEYISRNKEDSLLASNLHFFCKSLAKCSKLNSVIEFGANIGMNLKALNLLFPGISMSGVEINRDAVEILKETIPAENIHSLSILDFNSEDKQWDLVLIKGVLIHINPDILENVYETLVKSCRKYLLIGEYYNPSPVAVPYRGFENKLFKRDFAGEIMNKFPQMKLSDYGFAYRRDPSFPQDDITWFLLENSASSGD